MFNFFKTGVIIVALILFSGCVVERERRMVKPLEKMAAPFDNGSIFKPGFNDRPLFEERRARNVGDTLIMTVAAAPPAKKAETVEDRSAEDERRARRREQDEELSNIAADALVGNISMVVMDIMDNGYLYVVGGRQAIVGERDRYVRISGVVDPRDLDGGNNMVPSTLVSDVRIQVDDVRIYSDGTASRFSEGQSTFGHNFQSMGRQNQEQ